jgi:metal-dependent amidase/aminoacylase/carboxypeptidase family protein
VVLAVQLLGGQRERRDVAFVPVEDEQVARTVAGENAVDTTVLPLMGAEDFSYMLERRPGAMIFMGNGDTAGLIEGFVDGTGRPYGLMYRR